ncbi:hypothetical protein KKI96_20180, partial [Xenorhabdus bovienii]|nr:hypothetical protein [Xenorhabdus bovienii]
WDFFDLAINQIAKTGLSSLQVIYYFESLFRGSACSSTSTQTSRVLSAMGLNMQCISSTIRISFSPLNHVHEVELLCNKISEFKNSRL